MMYSTCVNPDLPEKEEGDEQDVEPNIRSFARKGDDSWEKAEYQLLGHINNGGMGAIYEALHKPTNRIVAVKVCLLPTRQAVRRLLSEARTVAGLEHPAIVPVYDICYMDSSGPLYKKVDVDLTPQPFLVMRKMPGRTWKPEEKSLADNLRILSIIGEAVAYAHNRDVSHRDIKPGNVLLGDHGEVYLSDWGLSLSNIEDENRGYSLGTLAYAPPQMTGDVRNTDGVKTDIYLLGALLFTILYGKPPHQGEDDTQTQEMAKRNDFVCHEAGEGMRELDAIAMRAMRTDPGERYATVAEFLGELRKMEKTPVATRLLKRGRKLMTTALAAPGRDANSILKIFSGLDKAEVILREAQDLAGGDENIEEAQAELAFKYADLARQQGDLHRARAKIKEAERHHWDAAEISQLKAKIDKKQTRLLNHRTTTRRLLWFAAVSLGAFVIGMSYTLYRVYGESKKVKTLYESGANFADGIMYNAYLHLRNVSGVSDAIDVIFEHSNEYVNAQSAIRPFFLNILVERWRSLRGQFQYAQMLEDKGLFEDENAPEGKGARTRFENILSEIDEMSEEERNRREYRYLLGQTYFRLGYISTRSSRTVQSREDAAREATAHLRKAIAIFSGLARPEESGGWNILNEQITDDLDEAEYIKLTVRQRYFPASDGGERELIREYQALANRIDKTIRRRETTPPPDKMAKELSVMDAVVRVRHCMLLIRIANMLRIQGDIPEWGRCLDLASEYAAEAAEKYPYRIDIIRNTIWTRLESINFWMPDADYPDNLVKLDSLLQFIIMQTDVNPQDKWLKNHLGQCRRRRSQLMGLMGNADGARRELEREVDLRRAMVANQNENYAFREDLATACVLLADACFKAGDYGRAKDLYGEAVENSRENNKRRLMDANIGLARLAWRDGNAAEAANRLDTAEYLHRSLGTTDSIQPETAVAMVNALALRTILPGNTGNVVSKEARTPLLELAKACLDAPNLKWQHHYDAAKTFMAAASLDGLDATLRRELLTMAGQAAQKGLEREGGRHYTLLLDRLAGMSR